MLIAALSWFFGISYEDASKELEKTNGTTIGLILDAYEEYVAAEGRSAA